MDDTFCAQTLEHKKHPKEKLKSQQKIQQIKSTKMEEDAMSYSEAAIITIFGVILPTGDVGSDYWLAGVLFLKDSPCLRQLDKRYLYGGITLIFPMLSFAFTTHHWWQMENPTKKGGPGRLKTLPLLLCQVWPQYRMIRILYLGLVKKDPQWRRERNVMMENVSAVEPFIESVPQCFWILCLGYLTYQCVGWSPAPGWDNGSIDGILSGWTNRSIDDILGSCAFSTSVVSASYGLTNFLRVGPLKVIPNQPASGFGHPCFFLVFFSVLSSIVAKGILFGDFAYNGKVLYACLGLFVPNMLLSLTSLLAALGFKDSIILAIRHPAIVMMPVFTSFAFGPERSNCKCQLGGKLRLHYGLTISNLIITFIAGFGVFLLGQAEGPGLMLTLFLGLPLFVVSALSTTVFILCDMCSSCSSCAKPVRVVREIKDLLGDSQSLDDIAREKKDHQQPSAQQQPLDDIEMQTFG